MYLLLLFHAFIHSFFVLLFYLGGGGNKIMLSIYANTCQVKQLNKYIIICNLTTSIIYQSVYSKTKQTQI